MLKREGSAAPVGPYDPEALTIVAVGRCCNIEVSDTHANFLIKLIMPFKKRSQI
jgi:hypothetical protein